MYMCICITTPQSLPTDQYSCFTTKKKKWMVMMRACSDHSNDLNISGSFITSLKPQPPKSTSEEALFTHVDNIFSQNHHFGHVSRESYKDSDIAQAPVSGCSRWNPTPEQVQVLKEMYRLGTRSPTAEHIQQITALLRRFGRVEGKNVFYWFQNHKARERQRRRREKLEAGSQEHKCYVAESRERKKTGVRRACCEVEESSNWGPFSIPKCNLQSEEPVSVHRTQTSSNNGWTQFEERDLHHITTMSLSSSKPTTRQLTQNPSAPNTQDHGNQQRQYQMLELFPLGSNNVSESQAMTSTMSTTSFSPSQFVEFLPPKV